MERPRRKAFQSREPKLLTRGHTTNSYGQIMLHIRISPRYAAYFGVEYWIRQRPAFEATQIFVKKQQMLNQQVFQLIDVSFTYVECWGWLIDRIARLFNRCSRVQSLYLDANLVANQPHLIHKSLQNIVIEELTWSDFKDYSSPLEVVLFSSLIPNFISQTRSDDDY